MRRFRPQAGVRSPVAALNSPIMTRKVSGIERRLSCINVADMDSRHLIRRSVSSPVARQSRGARASDSGRYQAGGSDSRRGEISVASRVRPLFAFQDQCAGSMSIVARTAALTIARLTPGVMPYSISRNSRTSSRRSYSPWPRHRLPGNRACRLGFPVCDSMPSFRSRPRLLSGAPDVLRKVPPCLPPDCVGEHRGKAGGPRG